MPRNVSHRSDAFIYFAGHGAPEPQTGERFLVPWDADPAYIATQGIGIPRLLSRLGKLNVSHVYVFLDACFSGAGGRSVLPAGTRPLVMMRKWPKPEAARVLVLTASGPNETTGVDRSGHGLFSSYLLRGLNGEADSNRDGAVSFAELATYTGEQVANEARRANRDQHPRALGAENHSQTAILTRQPWQNPSLQPGQSQASSPPPSKVPGNQEPIQNPAAPLPPVPHPQLSLPKICSWTKVCRDVTIFGGEFRGPAYGQLAGKLGSGSGDIAVLTPDGRLFQGKITFYWGAGTHQEMAHIESGKGSGIGSSQGSQRMCRASMVETNGSQTLECIADADPNTAHGVGVCRDDASRKYSWHF